MSSSCSLLTCHAMRKAELESVTSEATGHPIEMAFDWNPDTYWAPSSTASNTIQIDLQSAIDIDGLALFVRNYDTDFAAETVQLASSSDGSIWNTEGNWTIMSYGAVGVPLKVFPVTALPSRRYWRVTFGGTITQVIQVAAVMLYNSNIINQGSEFAEFDETEYVADVDESDGSHSKKRLLNYLPTRTLPRQWTFDIQASFDVLATAIDRSLGSGLPMILVEGGLSYLVETQDEAFNHAESGYLSYEPRVTFITLPYNADGKGY